MATIKNNHVVDQESGCRIGALELTSDFNERSEPNLGLMHWFRGEGVDVAHVFNFLGPISELDITAKRHRFKFAHSNATNRIKAVVHVATDDNAETPIDLVAWTRERPERVFQSLGAVEALGVDQIGNPASYFLSKPLLVHRHPLNWLRAGCDGIVIFDARCVCARLECLPPRLEGYDLATGSIEHGRELQRILSPLPNGLRILVPMPGQQGQFV
jgi:hypothetical protein